MFQLQSGPGKDNLQRDNGKLQEKFHNEWIDSKRKILKNTGKAYNSRNGKLRDEKHIAEPCKCKLKCFEKLDENARNSIIQQFSMWTHSKQYDFIIM